MLITLDHTSATPLYQQVVDAIRDQILTGQLQPGALLPSIRQLASDLCISVITTRRAYQDLEIQGLIRTRPGRGTFVVESQDLRLDEMRLLEIQRKLGEGVDAAFRLGANRSEIEELLKRIVDLKEDR